MNRTDPKGCEQSRDHRTECQSSTECGLAGNSTRVPWVGRKLHQHAITMSWTEMQLRTLGQMVCIEERSDQHYLAFDWSERGKIGFVS